MMGVQLQPVLARLLNFVLYINQKIFSSTYSSFWIHYYLSMDELKGSYLLHHGRC
jgi:hypothetical protein